MRLPARLAALLLATIVPAATAGERTRSALMELLPRYDPSPPAVQPPPAAAQDPGADGGVVVLPEFRVVERRIAKPAPDDWLTGAAITRREVRRAEAGMGALDLALNRWHIPLLSPSFAQRTHAAHEQHRRSVEMGRLERLQRIGGP